MPFGVQERVADAVVDKLRSRARRCGAARRARAAGRESRREESVPAGPLSPEPAHRRRAAEGRRLLREGARRGRAVRARRTAAWPTPTACSRTTACWARRMSGRRPRRSAASAVMLDDHSAEAHTSLAHVKATQDWDWAGAEREFRRAIALNPRYATGASLVRARRAWRRSAGSTKRCDEMLHRAVARSGVVDRRARSRGDPLLPARLRDRARAVRPHHRAQPAFRAGLLDARRHPGTAPRFRRVGGRLSARGAPVAAHAAHARRARPHVRALGQARSSRWKCCASSRLTRRSATSRRSSSRGFSSRSARRTRGSAGSPRPASDRSFDLICIKVDPRFDPLRDDRRFAALAKQLHVE